MVRNPQDDPEVMEDPLGEAVDRLEEEIELHQGNAVVAFVRLCDIECVVRKMTRRTRRKKHTSSLCMSTPTDQVNRLV